MLIGVGDVGAVSIEKAGDGRDEAFTVGTVDQENGRVSHLRYWRLGREGAVRKEMRQRKQGPKLTEALMYLHPGGKLGRSYHLTTFQGKRTMISGSSLEFDY